MISLLLACSFFLAVCSGNCAPTFFGPNCMTRTFQAVLSGTNEVPPVVSPYGGKVSVFYGPTSIDVLVDSDITVATAAHIHRASVGSNGPVSLPLSVSGGVVQDLMGASLGALDLTLLLNEGYYVNVHSAANPGGEIRGQLVPYDANDDPCFLQPCVNGGTCFSFPIEQPGVHYCECPPTFLGPDCSYQSFKAVLSGANEVPNPVSSPYSGEVTIVYHYATSTDGEVTILALVESDLDVATGAHIHRAPAGSNGPVVIAFQISNGVVQNLPLTDASSLDINLLLNGGYYVNFHTSANPGGEIRGQIETMDMACTKACVNNFGICQLDGTLTESCLCLMGHTGEFCEIAPTTEPPTTQPPTTQPPTTEPPTTEPPTTEPPTTQPPTTEPPTTQPPTTQPPTTQPPMPCSAETYGNAMWPMTNEGTVAAGTCLSGFSGNPFRDCLPGGMWASFLSFPCQPIRCPSETLENALWPSTAPNSATYGTCQAGFVGRPYRQCQADGTWGPIQDTCQDETLQCPSQNYANAMWSMTDGGSLAQGTCVSGYSGSPLRRCEPGGSWNSLVNNHCRRNRCPQEMESGASWDSTISLTTARGTCAPGTVGDVTRFCQADGTWAAVSGSCFTPGNCPANRFARADWPVSSPGTWIQGSCIPGWTGAPIRRCQEDGTWPSLVFFHCQRI